MNRIPPYKLNSRAWYVAMRDSGLLFHLDDLPEDLISNKTGEPLFNETECLVLKAILPWIVDTEFFDAWSADNQ